MLTKSRIQELIVGSLFPDLIGQRESEWLECKSEIYDLSNSTKKLELAKDVSSFANADGGYIVLGIKTRQSPLHFADEITELTPFDSGLLNPNQYYGVLNSWLFPRIEGLLVEWIASSIGSNQGFGVITVPSQSQTIKPFLMTRTLAETGKVSEILFGYAKRIRDGSEPMEVRDLHQALRDGFRFSYQIERRFSDIESQIALIRVQPPLPAPEISESEVIARLNQALAELDLIDKPHLGLFAWPVPQTELRTIFKSQPETLGYKLEHPPEIRPNGFDVDAGTSSKSIEGRLRRANSHHKILDLYRDGGLCFGAGADHLCWSMNGTVMNTLALIETIYTFFLLYDDVLRDMAKAPSKIKVMLWLGAMSSSVPSFGLIPKALGPHRTFWGKPLEPPKNRLEQVFEITSEKFGAGSAAYQILNEIFIWYGAEADTVPYADNVEGARRISEKQITEIA